MTAKQHHKAEITYQKHVVILGLGAQILEDRLLPKLLHVRKVLNETVADGPSSSIGLLVLNSLVADEAVQILNTLTDGTIRLVLRGDHSGENVARLGVTGITHLGVARERQTSQRKQDKGKVCVSVLRSCVSVYVSAAQRSSPCFTVVPLQSLLLL